MIIQIISQLNPEYFYGVLLGTLASIVGALSLVYKKKDDDDHISKGEFFYIILRGALSSFAVIKIGYIAFGTYQYSILLAIFAGLLRGKFLEDLTNFGNTILTSVFERATTIFKEVLGNSKPLSVEPKTAPLAIVAPPVVENPEPEKKSNWAEVKEAIKKVDTDVKYYSQLDSRWGSKLLPNAEHPSITIKNYGCLLSTIATLFQIEPDKLAYDNPDCFQTDGNMLTDKLLERLGSKMERVDIPEGSEIPKQDKAVICRTSWYSDKSRSGLSISFPTHFYILLPDGNIIDPARTYPEPNPVNKYKDTTNQIRLVSNIKI